MYRKILFLLTCLLAFANISAKAPWVSESFRTSNYPADRFYIGFHSMTVSPGNDRNEIVLRTLDAARGMLANSIYSDVTSVSRSDIKAENLNGIYTESESLYNSFRTSSSANLVNINILQDYDDDTDTAYALAYVSKSDLASFYEHALDNGLQSLDSSMQTIDRLVNDRYVSEAKKECGIKKTELDNLKKYIEGLQKVKPSSSGIGAWSTRIMNLDDRLNRYINDLDHGISVYVDIVSAQPDSLTVVPVRPAGEKVKGHLAVKGCNIVLPDQPRDYTLELSYTTRTSSKTSVGWFAFADVDVKVIRNRDNLTLLQDNISVKGGGGTEEKAHRKALDLSSAKIIEAVSPYIK